MDIAPPLADGRYRLLSILGEGGMATVYRGFDERLEVERAIKVLSPLLAARADIRKRFETEARTMAKLQHPNIVSVQDVGTDGDRVYMVMELLETGSLIDLLDKNGAMAPHAACDAIVAILTGLQIAHARGVVHRDIKPHNVLVTPDGQYKVADFGIAHISGADRSATRTGMAMGTLSYMAPEQRSNAKQVDGRADLYAVSATFYALLTNSEPFELHAADHQEEIFQGISKPLVDIMKRASRFRAEDRFPDAGAMIEAIRQARAMIGPSGSVLGGAMPPGNPTLAVAHSEAFIGLAPTPAGGATDARSAPLLRTASTTGSGTFYPHALDDLQAYAAPVNAPAASPNETERPVARAASAPAPGTLASAGLRTNDTVMTPEPPTGAPTRSNAYRLLLIGMVLSLGVIALGVVGGAADFWHVNQPEAPTGEVVDPGAGPIAAAPVSGLDASTVPAVGSTATPAAATVVIPPPPATTPVKVAPTPLPPASPRTTTPVKSANPKSPPPVGAPAAMQTLYVNSLPFSHVTVDGKSVGTTPWSGAVTVGPHRVGLTKADRDGKVLKITVKETEPMHFCWDFSTEAECSR